MRGSGVVSRGKGSECDSLLASSTQPPDARCEIDTSAAPAGESVLVLLCSLNGRILRKQGHPSQGTGLIVMSPFSQFLAGVELMYGRMNTVCRL